MWQMDSKTFKLLSLYEYKKYEKESNYQCRPIEGGGGRYVIEEQISFPPKIIWFQCSYFISAVCEHTDLWAQVEKECSMQSKIKGIVTVCVVPSANS